jgi:hypothetical protein
MNECIYKCIRTTSNLHYYYTLYRQSSLWLELVALLAVSIRQRISNQSLLIVCNAMTWSTLLLCQFQPNHEFSGRPFFILSHVIYFERVFTMKPLKFSIALVFLLCVVCTILLWIVHSSMPLPFFSIVYLKVFRVSIPHGLNSVVKIGRDYLYLRETLVLISYSIWVSVPKQWLLVG